MIFLILAENQSGENENTLASKLTKIVNPVTLKVGKPPFPTEVGEEPAKKWMGAKSGPVYHYHGIWRVFESLNRHDSGFVSFSM